MLAYLTQPKEEGEPKGYHGSRTLVSMELLTYVVFTNFVENKRNDRAEKENQGRHHWKVFQKGEGNCGSNLNQYDVTFGFVASPKSNLRLIFPEIFSGLTSPQMSS